MRTTLKIEAVVGRAEVENSEHSRIHVAVKVEGPMIDPGERVPLKLIIVLDISGSMQEPASEGGQLTKLMLAKRIPQRLIPFVRPDDLIGLVVFSRQATLLLPPTTMSDLAKRRLADEVDSMQIESDTNLADALSVACRAAQQMRTRPDEPVYVLLLTDGEPTVGITNPTLIVRLLKRPWAAGVRLLCAGIGQSYNPALLSELARASAGYFVHIVNETQFAEAMGDLLGAAASVQHVNLSVEVLPDHWVTLTQVFTTDDVRTAADSTTVLLGDIFAESVRAVGFEFRFSQLPAPLPRELRVARIRVSGIDARTAVDWVEKREVAVTVVEPGTVRAPHNEEAYRLLVTLVAKSAAAQAMAYAEQGQHGLAVGRIDQAIQFVRSCNRFCNVDAALEHLERIREIVSQPDRFARGRHFGRSTTVWFGERGAQAGQQTRVQQRFTVPFRPAELKPPEYDGKAPSK